MGSNPAPVTLDHSTLHSFKLTFVLHLQNLKSLQGYYCKLHSHDLAFTTLVQLDFTFLQQHNLKSLSTVSMYINVHHSRTTWILLHSYNLISGVLHLRSLTSLSFGSNDVFHATLAHPDFHYNPTFSLLFHSCYLCMFSYVSIFLTYIYV